MTNKEAIRDVAIKTANGDVWALPRPYRHSDVMSEMNRSETSLTDSVQGFVTTHGRFVNRTEAYKIAHAAGQIIFRDDVTPTPGTLYSEDLW